MFSVSLRFIQEPVWKHFIFLIQFGRTVITIVQFYMMEHKTTI